MDPNTVFCPRSDCPLRGQVGPGNIGVNSQKERRYICYQCVHTFAATRGTVFYRLRTASECVSLVLKLLAHGCPVQAIVAAFGIDERTVASWQERAGEHCREVHEHLVQAGNVDLEHVQADELYVKGLGWRGGLGLAIAAKSRLWLAAEWGETRKLSFLIALAAQVRACAQHLAVLVCVDGLAGYPQAFRRCFRKPVYTGKRGRPTLVSEKGFLVAQMVKRYAGRRLEEVTRQVCRACAAQVAIGTSEEVATVIEGTGQARPSTRPSSSGSTP